MIKLEDKTATDILKAVLDAAQIDEQQFAMRHMTLSQDPQTAEFVMAAQQGKLSQPQANKQTTMSKQQTLKTLQTTQRVQLEQMRDVQAQMNQAPPTSQEEQMKMMVQMMVQQCKAQDKIYIETGEEFENEEFENALLYYCARDPEVAKKMQEYMQNLRGAMPAQ